jgi:hypothetical protein
MGLSAGDRADGFRGDWSVSVLPLEEVAVMSSGDKSTRELPVHGLSKDSPDQNHDSRQNWIAAALGNTTQHGWREGQFAPPVGIAGIMNPKVSRPLRALSRAALHALTLATAFATVLGWDRKADQYPKDSSKPQGRDCRSGSDTRPSFP